MSGVDKRNIRRWIKDPLPVAKRGEEAQRALVETWVKLHGDSPQTPLTSFLRQHAPDIAESTFRDWVKKHTSQIPASKIRHQLTIDQQAQELRAWFKEKEKNPALTHSQFCTPKRLALSTFRHLLPRSDDIFRRAAQWHDKYARRKHRPSAPRYKKAEDRVFQLYQDGLAKELFMPPKFFQDAMVQAVKDLYGENAKFCASNSWLHGKVTRYGKKKKGFTMGWKHRYGVSFREVTKSSPVSLEHKLDRLRRHQWWLVNRMAKPKPGKEEECSDPRYGLYEGRQRFAADQVPMAFNKIFRRTATKRGAKSVFGWKTLKAIDKRDRPQPPQFIILEGAPTRNADGSYNTKMPVDANKKRGGGIPENGCQRLLGPQVPDVALGPGRCLPRLPEVVG